MKIAGVKLGPRGPANCDTMARHASMFRTAGVRVAKSGRAGTAFGHAVRLALRGGAAARDGARAGCLSAGRYASIGMWPGSVATRAIQARIAG